MGPATHSEASVFSVRLQRDRRFDPYSSRRRDRGRNETSDCETHRDDPRTAKVVDEARAHCVSLKVLGSYPKAGQIL